MRYALLLLFLTSCSTLTVPNSEEVPIRDIDMELEQIFNIIGG